MDGHQDDPCADPVGPPLPMVDSLEMLWLIQRERNEKTYSCRRLLGTAAVCTVWYLRYISGLRRYRLLLFPSSFIDLTLRSRYLIVIPDALSLGRLHPQAGAYEYSF